MTNGFMDKKFQDIALKINDCSGKSRRMVTLG
jgi:hypothetical protein